MYPHSLVKPHSSQSGVMLLEALIAILIFSFGVLGIVGMQATAINTVQDAKFRSDAALLANELIGEMMARKGIQSGPSGQTPAELLRAEYLGDGDEAGGVATDGPRFTAWKTRVAGVLPGVGGPDVWPTVAIGQLTNVCAPLDGDLDPAQGVAETNTVNATAVRVCIVVRWRTQREDLTTNAGLSRSYRVVVDLI